MQISNTLIKMIPTILSALKEEIAELQVVYLYGSFAQNRENHSSDVDIALWSDVSMSNLDRWNVQEHIASMLNIDIDLIDLRSATLTLSYEVVQTGMVLYQNNTFDKASFELNIISQYLDFEQASRALIKDIARRGYIYG